MPKEENDIYYVDDWVVGWNLHRCSYTLKEIEQAKKGNDEYWKKHNKIEHITEGLLHGWQSRENLRTDIEIFHGKEWANKFSKAFGDGNTGIVVPEVGLGIYYWDYLRFADIVDGITKTTYWD